MWASEIHSVLILDNVLHFHRIHTPEDLRGLLSIHSAGLKNHLNANVLRLSDLDRTEVARRA
jgi:hypothetical protein